MTLRGILEDDEYLPEYGSVVIRDKYAEDGLPALPNELLTELATEALSGTVATAGDGWLHGTAGDPYQAVRLEAHDVEPHPQLEEWEDVLETPFRSRSGRIALGFLTGGEFGDVLELGERGFFRARVARRVAEEGQEGDVWLVQFWPSAPVPPRWVKRTRPAVHPADPGWRQVFGYHVMEVAWFAGGTGMHRPESWLDEPVPDPPDPALCAQLGVPAPVSRRDTIALLVAAGLLAPEGDGHRYVQNPPSATERLELPAELVAQIERAATSARYVWLAADLTCVAAWGDPAPLDGLAERLLVPQEEIPPLLAYAVASGLIRQGADGLRALPRRMPESRPVVVPVMLPRGENPSTFEGAPPRAGIVSGDGDVMVWRIGGPVVLGRVPDQHRYRAFETPVGIVVSTSGGPGTLVRWDGTAERLGADLGSHPVRSADGRLLGGVEIHVGRRSWDRPHLLDVVTGEVASLPDADELTRRALAVHDGALYYTESRYGSGSRTFRWRPGSEPEPLAADVWQVDPLSGAMIVRNPDGVVVETPAGRVPVPADRLYELAPGGERLYAFQYAPPSAWLLDVGAAEPEEHPLPEGCDTSTSIPAGPFWETPGTLVFHRERGRTRLVRWHMAHGRFDRFDHFDLPEIAGYRPFAIQPMLARSK